MYKQNFNLQKAPIVCYARKFPHKMPPCYALNTQKGPHVIRVGKMPAFMSKVHAGGIYRYLPAFTDIAGFCYCFLVLAQN